MQSEQFEVRKDKLSQTRVVSREIPALVDAEVLVRIDRFALTANNITYGVIGDAFGYWDFFPTETGWGLIPVWGFADVIESKHVDIKIGERLYGYFPMATHLVIRADRVKENRLVDGAAHRTELAPVYNSYARTSGEAHYDAAMDAERMLLFPLYATSFCLYDFMVDNDYFSATQVVIPSASSKTAIGLAYALQEDSASPFRVGLTSERNRAKVEALGLYDQVATYDSINTIDNTRPTVIVDMSGSGKVLSDLHGHLGDNMKFTSKVGATHYMENEVGPHFIRERSSLFFAPTHIQKRTREWGPGEFDKRAFRFWQAAAIKSRDWLVLEKSCGMEQLAEVYARVLDGNTQPEQGIIVSL